MNSKKEDRFIKEKNVPTDKKSRYLKDLFRDSQKERLPYWWGFKTLGLTILVLTMIFNFMATIIILNGMLEEITEHTASLLTVVLFLPVFAGVMLLALASPKSSEKKKKKE